MNMKAKTLVVPLGAIAALVLSLLVLSLRDKKTDIERIQGEWKVTFLKERGQSVQEPIDAVFEGDKLVFKRPTGRIEEFTYRLDDSHQPAWFDIVAPMEHMQGIYVLEGDVLRICLNENSDGRATAFDPGTDTPHTVVLVLERDPSE